MTKKSSKPISVSTEVIDVDPKELILLKVNARYMKHEVFQRLVENVKRDGELTQLPFAIWRAGKKKYEVLSGNHRAKAAIAAGLTTIKCQVTKDKLTKDHERAIQLSHNSITGEDDPALLKMIYSDIGDVEMKLYAGLDDKTLKLLDEVTIGSIAEANLDFQTISIVFLPHELDVVAETFTKVKDAVAGSKEVWLTRWAEYDDLLDAIEAAGDSHGVKNTATALMVLVELVKDHITELKKGWIPESEAEGATGAKEFIPITTLLGWDMPVKVAHKFTKVIEKMEGRYEIDAGQYWQTLDRLADLYLAQEAGDEKAT